MPNEPLYCSSIDLPTTKDDFAKFPVALSDNPTFSDKTVASAVICVEKLAAIPNWPCNIENVFNILSEFIAISPVAAAAVDISFLSPVASSRDTPIPFWRSVSCLSNCKPDLINAVIITKGSNIPSTICFPASLIPSFMVENLLFIRLPFSSTSPAWSLIFSNTLSAFVN